MFKLGEIDHLMRRKSGQGSLYVLFPHPHPFPNSTIDPPLRVAIVYPVVCSAYTPTLPVPAHSRHPQHCDPTILASSRSEMQDLARQTAHSLSMVKVNTFFWSQRVHFKGTVTCIFIYIVRISFFFIAFGPYFSRVKSSYIYKRPKNLCHNIVIFNNLLGRIFDMQLNACNGRIFFWPELAFFSMVQT